MNIRLFLNDYDVAAELYDLLFKYLKTFEYSDDRFPYVGDDRRTGTNWSSYVYINGSFYSSHIAMQRQTFNNFVGRKEVKRTCFYIEVSIPIKNLNR